MIPYFSRRFETSQSGTRLASVECEQCNCQYFYELTRIGTGTASAAYGLGATSAEASSQLQSTAELQDRLTGEAELVACPQCHWINAELVEGYREGRYRWAAPLAAGVAFFGTVAALISAAYLWFGPAVDRVALPYVLIGGPGISVSIGVAIVLVRNFLRSRIRPNRDFPDPPRVPAGVPPALLLDEATQTLKPVERDVVSASDECGWHDFQIGRHQLPQSCCQCMNEASDEHVWKHPVTVAVELSLPRCAECRRKSGKEYLLAWIVSLAVSLGTGIGALLMTGLDDEFFWILAVCHVLVSLGIAAFYASARSAPARLRIVDQSRGIVRLRFRNPAYRPESVWTDHPDVSA
jgi:hypothetical protein